MLKCISFYRNSACSFLIKELLFSVATGSCSLKVLPAGKMISWSFDCYRVFWWQVFLATHGGKFLRWVLWVFCWCLLWLYVAECNSTQAQCQTARGCALQSVRKEPFCSSQWGPMSLLSPQGVVADTSPQTVAPSSQDTSGQQQQIAVDTASEHASAYSYQQSK